MSKSYIEVDALLVGGGIMSATMASLLAILQPDWKVVACERLSAPAMESSNAWNNAGTGHSALCELNYMPEGPDGELSVDKAVGIAEQFQISRQFWATLTAQGNLGDPTGFIRTAPHMTAVFDDKGIDYLRRRHRLLAAEPLFAGMQYSELPEQIAQWAPLLTEGRPADEPMAVTWDETGTDVNFGELTRRLFGFAASASPFELVCGHEVRSLSQQEDGRWLVGARGSEDTRFYRARFVFVGAGGYALKLLQKARVPEAKGFGLFPVSGKFLRCENPEVIRRHGVKVYGQAKVGAPPMSVPHLDARYIDGQPVLLFGPYAGLIPKFLKHGSVMDLPASVRPNNIWPMLQAAGRNLSLIKYLAGELLKSKKRKFAALQEFMPTAKPGDWSMLTAGQRAQIIKKDPEKGGVLQFGTEVVRSKDGSIAALLGASPGASTSVAVIVQLLLDSFPSQQELWRQRLPQLIPYYGQRLNDDTELAQKSLTDTAAALRL